ncbi:MAG: hypothetical protein LBH51_10655, partial [Treponema sp.]|nr:hypothetical protein [Treponema sp.]
RRIPAVFRLSNLVRIAHQVQDSETAGFHAGASLPFFTLRGFCEAKTPRHRNSRPPCRRIPAVFRLSNLVRFAHQVQDSETAGLLAAASMPPPAHRRALPLPAGRR